MKEETKAKISERLKGTHKIFSQEHKDNIRASFTDATRASLKERMTGESNPNWKGGKTAEALVVRNSAEYRHWRMSVFRRDNFTCVSCALRGGELNADHIKRFSDYPELRFVVENGRTLCVSCHRLTDTYGLRNKKTT